MTTESSNTQASISPNSASALAGKAVLVTGATGFIGSRLVDVLVSNGAKVSVILRSNHGAKALRARNVKVYVVNLSDRTAFAATLSQQEIVFHLAYDVRASGRENIESFQAVFETVQASEIERIVHLSSLVVYDHWPDGEIKFGSSITRTGLEDYRDAKIVMEEALMAGRKSAAILQPGIVYGPGSAMWTDAPRAALRRGPVILPDPIGNCPAIHVDDVVQAAVLAAELPELSQERFILNGPDNLSWADFFQSHIAAIDAGRIEFRSLDSLRARFPEMESGARSTGGPSFAARVSHMARQILGRKRFEAIVASISNIFTKSGPVYPDRNALELYASNGSVDDASTRERLGFKPKIACIPGS